ncbi:hypothetical protein M011DRAFT_345548 [Sporormia fimetaria CBS 119925]|uniref:Uncharacterized protein n=1 Tax=Sporormia fimetaria CBS 119925 TaxID=1340428 RepID=A0A6A6VGM8_9PLEO|nr:hypothetical protein M011DRAFT_345548 [Sporormia fimetaria CBS 119925]
MGIPISLLCSLIQDNRYVRFPSSSIYYIAPFPFPPPSPLLPTLYPINPKSNPTTASRPTPSRPSSQFQVSLPLYLPISSSKRRKEEPLSALESVAGILPCHCIYFSVCLPRFSRPAYRTQDSFWTLITYFQTNPIKGDECRVTVWFNLRHSGSSCFDEVFVVKYFISTWRMEAGAWVGCMRSSCLGWGVDG